MLQPSPIVELVARVITGLGRHIIIVDPRRVEIRKRSLSRNLDFHVELLRCPNRVDRLTDRIEVVRRIDQ